MNEELRELYMRFRDVYPGRDSRVAFSRITGLPITKDKRTPTLNNYLATPGTRMHRGCPEHVMQRIRRRIRRRRLFDVCKLKHIG